MLLGLPLAAAGAAGVGFYAMLRAAERDDFDPRSIGHPLVGKPLPAFALEGLGSADLVGRGPFALNFFASWCPPCIEEAPALTNLGRTHAPFFGIAWKDKPANAADFLRRYGNPFRSIAVDATGLVGIDFGVTAVPETFIADAAGIVRWHYAGPMSEQMVAGEVAPRLLA